MWVPPNSYELKLKLLPITHSVSAVNRGIYGTVVHIRVPYTWSGIDLDVRDFVADCLLFVMSQSGLKVPSPLSLTLHATKPNEVLHFDSLFLGHGAEENSMCSY